MENELKKMTQQYQEVHGNLTAMKRKRGYDFHGLWLVCDV